MKFKVIFFIKRSGNDDTNHAISWMFGWKLYLQQILYMFELFELFVYCNLVEKFVVSLLLRCQQVVDGERHFRRCWISQCGPNFILPVASGWWMRQLIPDDHGIYKVSMDQRMITEGLPDILIVSLLKLARSASLCIIYRNISFSSLFAPVISVSISSASGI